MILKVTGWCVRVGFSLVNAHATRDQISGRHTWNMHLIVRPRYRIMRKYQITTIT